MDLRAVKNCHILKATFEEMVGGRDPEATCADDENLVGFADCHYVALEMWRRRLKFFWVL